MAWVQIFPTSSTQISQSVAQIQANWLYIQTTMQDDHYFADGTATNDGHHKFVHLPTVTDQAVILTGVVYQKLNSVNNPKLYHRTAAVGSEPDIQQIPTAMVGSVVIPAAQTTATILDFTGYPAFQGIFTAMETTNHKNRCSCFITFNTTSVDIMSAECGTASTKVLQTIFTDGLKLRCTKTAAALTLRYSLIKTAG